MSGFEVAGVVLGCIPLAISALEHYRDLAEKAGRLTAFETKYRNLLADLRDEEVILRLQLERLLRPLVLGEVLEEDDLDALVASPEDPRWADADLGHAIKQRLGRTYDNYIRTMGEAQQDSMRLLKCLGYEKDAIQERIFAKQAANPQQTQASTRLIARARKHFNLEFQAQRLKFALDKERHDDILKDLRAHHERLGKYLDLSSEIATLHDDNRPSFSRFAIKSLLNYWSHAERLYDLLCKSWRCACKQQHCAHLWLQHRTAPTFSFAMTVLFGPKHKLWNQRKPWLQQGLQIEAVKQAESVSVLVPPTLPLRSGQKRKQTGDDGPASVKSGARPTSAQSGPSFQTSTTILTTTPAVCFATSPVTARPSPSSSRQIFDLCVSISSCTSCTPTQIGSLHDDVMDRHYNVLAQPETASVADEITLSALLQRTYGRRLPRRIRYTMALKIASSHLQLHSTPWATKQWSSSDIRFPRQGAHHADIHFDRPFVTADFANGAGSNSSATSNPDRAFSSLGVILLELVHNSTLEEHPLWEALSQTCSVTLPPTTRRMMVAREWAEGLEEEEGREVAEAVRWCLNESPMQVVLGSSSQGSSIAAVCGGAAGMNNQQWRRDLADRVILPLQKCCEYLK